MSDLDSPRQSMILDATGQPFAKPSIGEEYVQALARSARNTLWNRTVAYHNGYSTAQFEHWVETGESPWQEAQS